MTDYDRIEALALLRGVNTSLLHLLATAPIYVLAPIAEAYKSARTAIRILEFRSLGAPKQSEADSVAFRHGDIDQVCGVTRDAGEFTQPPNCVHESTKSNEFGHVEIVDSAHPMAAEGLRLADENAAFNDGEVWADKYGVPRWIFMQGAWQTKTYGENDLEYPNPSASGPPPAPYFDSHAKRINPGRRSESAWSVTWPSYSTLVGN